jgi:hypothetical protein
LNIKDCTDLPSSVCEVKTANEFSLSTPRPTNQSLASLQVQYLVCLGIF